MKNFNLGNVRSWMPIGVGEVLDVDCPENGHRTCQFEIMSDADIAVQVVFEDTSYLVGCGVGLLAVKFSIAERCGLVVLGSPEAQVMVRTHIDTQVIPASLDASYTSIEPREAGPTDELRRIMHLVELKNRQREQELLEDRRQRDALLESQAQQLEAMRQVIAAAKPADAVEAPADGGEGEAV